MADRHDRELWTTAEVAREFGVSQRSVMEWAKSGRLQRYGIRPWPTPAGDWRFDPREVRRAIRLWRNAGDGPLPEELRRYSRRGPRKLAIANNKGGVGKTTVAVNLAAALVEETGGRVLVIDADPQGNATRHFGFGREPGRRQYRATLADIWDLPDIEHRRPLAEIVVPAAEKIWLAPADDSLLVVEHALLSTALQLATVSQMPDPAALQRRLGEFFLTLPQQLWALSGKMDFDWVLIDLPPVLGPLTISGLTASNAYLVPVEPEEFSAHGIQVFEDLVDESMSYTGKIIHPIGYVLNHLKRDAIVRREFAEAVREAKGDKVFRTEIPESSAFAEAAALGVTIFQYAQRSRKAERLAAVFRELAREVIDRFDALEFEGGPEVTAVAES